MSKFLTILITVIITTIVVGFGAYYYLTEIQPETKKPAVIEDEVVIEEEIVIEEEVDEKAPLIAVRNGNQDPKPSNPDNPMIEYFIKGGDEEFGMLEMNFFNRREMHLFDGLVYFSDPTGQISVFDPETGDSELINIPDIVPTDLYLNQDTIANFLVEDGKIYYLRGICMESGAGPGICSIRSYDLETKENESIVEDLFSKIEPLHMNLTIITDVVGDTLKFRDMFGDAGHATTRLYDLDLTTGDIKLVDEASAGPAECYGDDENCDEKELAKQNEKFNNLVDRTPPQCGDYNVMYDIRGDLIIDDATLNDAFFVGCI